MVVPLRPYAGPLLFHRSTGGPPGVRSDFSSSCAKSRSPWRSRVSTWVLRLGRVYARAHTHNSSLAGGMWMLGAPAMLGCKVGDLVVVGNDNRNSKMLRPLCSSPSVHTPFAQRAVRSPAPSFNLTPFFVHGFHLQHAAESCFSTHMQLWPATWQTATWMLDGDTTRSWWAGGATLREQVGQGLIPPIEAQNTLHSGRASCEDVIPPRVRGMGRVCWLRLSISKQRNVTEDANKPKSAQSRWSCALDPPECVASTPVSHRPVLLDPV